MCTQVLFNCCFSVKCNIIYVMASLVNTIEDCTGLALSRAKGDFYGNQAQSSKLDRIGAQKDPKIKNNLCVRGGSKECGI